jgi:type III secretion protein R
MVSARRMASLLAAWVMVMVVSAPLEVWAESSTAGVSVGSSGNPLGLIVIMAGLALLPFVLVMVTSFVKVAVVLSLLRSAIGAQQVPPNQVITGLAILLSVYIMAPVGMQTWDVISPVVLADEARQEQKIGVSELRELAPAAIAPLRGFLLKHADETERLLLYDLALELRTPEQRKSLTPEDMIVAAPAFILTELKEAFVIGFLIFIPFLVIDLVCANILLSLGMHMLNPTTVSLPFKLLLFVLVDGWYLVIKGLIMGYV